MNDYLAICLPAIDIKSGQDYQDLNSDELKAFHACYELQE